MTRATPSQATSYVTAPAAEPLAEDDPLLSFTPVPHTHPRKNSITADRQRAFIAHLAATGIVKQAARHIGASLEALYKLRSKPGAEEFAAAWEAAVDRGVSRLEDCALARAIAGEERMVVSSGKVLGTEVRHNDALVMFFLKNRRADRYGTDVRRGHPLYERIRAEVIAELRDEVEENEEEVLQRLNAKIDLMRQRQEEMKLIEAEEAPEDEEMEEGEMEDGEMDDGQ